MQQLRTWARSRFFNSSSALALAALLGAAACSASGTNGTGPGGDGGAGDGPGGNPGGASSCAAGNSQALQVTGSDAPDGTGTPESVITINNLGTSGTYPRVTSMNPGTFGQTCPADACVKQNTNISGPLTPFNEEMTLNLRGPLELYDLAVYQPTQAGGTGASWSRVSMWNRCTSDNVVFMNNEGGNGSGIWTPCGGNSQSYASADGATAAKAPTTFSGSLANGVEVNVLSASACSGQGDSSECGFYRGVALHGWSGVNGAKIFVMRTRMPRYTGAPGKNYTDEPAIWMLNARIVRTAQYGCNCRGVGSPGGCGELDVAEVVKQAHPMHATSTIYSYQGAVGADGITGAGHYFLRPVNQSAILVVIYDAAGKIQMLRLAPDAFDFGAALDAATVADWSARSGFSMSPK